MKFKAFYSVVLIVFLSGCISSKFQAESAKLGTQAVLDQQVAAWNRGDMNGYMQGYWKSDSLQFIGRKGVNYGWEKTLQNYQRSYPNAEAMGQLALTVLHVEDINPTTAYVTGKWHLTRSMGNLEGYFTLLLRKIDNEWKIVSDHSS
ncbi:nuclear transport factor 2 family protein [Adhaeribacter sp. BT258]|uniref:Nuclear transport factor 2 family protein n=1 Tax=Adhaeribacter terrigena TaxID=2793070 RepID=A0ABS1C0B8_9BACT|nr:nuclear transport factor 2 family protein [Adhaeribacter terrigena]MBK0402836.1 nuclear transport factor 2 family protein [Adhaeribacter terrigena]